MSSVTPVSNTAFNKLNPSRLRKLMWLSFFALSLPTAVLVYKSYDQLKWEAFYQHRVLAEELSKTIDDKFLDLIRTEQRRAFSDYAFATSDSNNASLVKRSPLSTLPIENANLGVIGYFQIDASGQLSTPFLPTPSANNTQYVLAPSDKAQREEIQQQIRDILSTNQLVEQQSNVALNTELEEQETFSELESASNDSFGDDGLNSPTFASQKVSPTNQAAFDRLSESKSPISKKQVAAKEKNNVLNRLEELETSSPYKEKVNLRKLKTISKSDSANISAAVVGKESKLEEVLIAPLQTQTNNDISLFNDTDPFEVSLLSSGHFVLYRKVWRNEQRYIQGVLLHQQTILRDIIKSSFDNSLLFSMSNLTVIYQGNALANFNEQGLRDYSLSRSASALQGTLLLRARLSAPFNELEPVFTIRRLPASAGGKVIVWSAVIMILMLVLVIYSLYRMSLRNLALVNQQQDFVSAVSHELKTPLTSIRMYGEILQQGWADEEKKKSYYRFIFDESERLTRLINNVLELARMTRNETPVSLSPVTVNEVVDMVRSKIDSQIERAQFTLNITIDESSKEKQLNIDQDLFAQLIINLVDNALKFSKNAERKEINVNVSQHSNGKLCFSIRDYGPGIAKDQLKKIFTLFYRTENELTRNTTGTGIGLALVNQLTQLMNGKIDVINRDPGAEFQLFFDAIAD